MMSNDMAASGSIPYQHWTDSSTDCEHQIATCLIVVEIALRVEGLFVFIPSLAPAGCMASC